jgi:hypothetical protein
LFSWQQVKTLLASDEAVLVAGVFLFAYFLIQIARVALAFRWVRADITALDQQLEKSFGEWSPLHSNATASPFAAEWSRLVTQVGAFSREPFSQDPRIMQWFSSSLLDACACADRGFAERQAGALYLIGLAFSFIGLIAAASFAFEALALQTVADRSALTGALGNLLSVAMLKFGTAIIGILLALLLLAIFAVLRGRAERRLAELSNRCASRLAKLPRAQLDAAAAERVKADMEKAIQAINRFESVVSELAVLLSDTGDELVHDPGRPRPRLYFDKLLELADSAKSTSVAVSTLVALTETLEKRTRTVQTRESAIP